MFDVFKNRLELTGTLRTVTALKIGAGRSVDPTDPDVPVIKDAQGRPLIPGSSFKGAIRSRLESFLRGVNPTFAHDPSELTGNHWMARIKQLKAANLSDQDLTKELTALTDKVALLFGAPWLAGKVQIRDLTVQASNWFGQYQTRDGVAIARDTETAADQRKYDFQVVPAGTIFDFRAVAENLTEAELGLLMLGLTQFENEMIPLGGGRSRGLGVVSLAITEMIWVNPQNREALLTYMQNLVLGQMQDYIFTQQDMTSHRSDWASALLQDLQATPAPAQV
jgi:CRISPR-associated RAMP protein (TIGR02581 family)